MAIRDHDQRYGVTPPLIGLAKLVNDWDCASADDYAMADVEGRARPQVGGIDRRPSEWWKVLR